MKLKITSMDYKFYNLVKLEEKQYRKEVRAAESKIINSARTANRKQEAWNVLHPKFELTGEIINSPVY